MTIEEALRVGQAVVSAHSCENFTKYGMCAHIDPMLAELHKGYPEFIWSYEDELVGVRHA